MQPTTLSDALAMLACPVCHSALTELEQADVRLVGCQGCGRVYPVVDDIPVLIADRALPTAGEH